MHFSGTDFGPLSRAKGGLSRRVPGFDNNHTGQTDEKVFHCRMIMPVSGGILCQFHDPDRDIAGFNDFALVHQNRLRLSALSIIDWSVVDSSLTMYCGCLFMKRYILPIYSASRAMLKNSRPTRRSSAVMRISKSVSGSDGVSKKRRCMANTREPM